MISHAVKTGYKNLGAKKLFTLASIGTIACSVFIFCLFFAIGSNIQSLIRNIEENVSIQVFFDKDLDEDTIINIAEHEFRTDAVKSMRFISSDEAWDKFKVEYFDNNENLADAFSDDNPLADSASYEILLNSIKDQYDYVKYLKSIKGVRQVNYSNVIIDTLTSINIGLSTFSIILVVLLAIIAIILISNTISLASEFRAKENEIMKLIGATNFMIRSPFIVEGFFIGFFGSIIPLVFVFGSYNFIIKFFMSKAVYITNVFEPVPLLKLAIPLTLISVSFSCIICMFVSFLTIRKHLRV